MPVEGRVTKIHRTPGSYVGEGDAIVDLQIDDRFRLTICAPLAGKVMRCRDVGVTVKQGEKVTELTSVGTPTWEVFVGSRRTDAPGHAGRIGERLINRFGAGQVFKDIESLGPGVNYVDVIREKLQLAHVMVVVIGRRWADDQRLQDSNDLHREEIRTVIERGVHLLPLLVDGAMMPSDSQVPADIQPLLRRQAIEITDTRWDYDVGRVIDHLEKVLEGSPRRKRFLAQVSPGWDLKPKFQWITDNPTDCDLE
jgi:hypothetical protein